MLITTINSIMLLIPIIVNLKFQNIKENIKISSKNLLKIEIIESKFITKMMSNLIQLKHQLEFLIRIQISKDAKKIIRSIYKSI